MRILEVHFSGPHGRKLDTLLKIGIMRVSLLPLLWARLLHLFGTAQMPFVVFVDSHLLGGSAVDHRCAILPIPQSGNIFRDESGFIRGRLQSPDDFRARKRWTLLLLKACTKYKGGRCFLSEGRLDVSVKVRVIVEGKPSVDCHVEQVARDRVDASVLVRVTR